MQSNMCSSSWLVFLEHESDAENDGRAEELTKVTASTRRASVLKIGEKCSDEAGEH